MIYPMFFMILLTLGYAGYMGVERVKAVKRGEVDIRYYKAIAGYELPHQLNITTRHFTNLMETPTLFYVAGALIIATNLESSFTTGTGWVYLVARIAHMYIHNTYNFPLHRMAAFVASLSCIATLWVHLVIHL